MLITFNNNLPSGRGEITEYPKVFQTVGAEQVLVSAAVMGEDAVAYQEVDVLVSPAGAPASVFFARRWWLHGRKGTAAPAQLTAASPWAPLETGTVFTGFGLTWNSVAIPSSNDVVRIFAVGLSGVTLNWIARVQRKQVEG